MGKKIDIDTTATVEDLVALGYQIHLLRKKHQLSTVDLAKAANISRVTLHRIEKGEQSVTAGAYATVLHALGQTLGVNNTAPTHELPAKISLAKYPQLKRLAWQIKDDALLTHQEAWGIYSRNWRHLDQTELSEAEQALIAELQNKFEGPENV